MMVSKASSKSIKQSYWQNHMNKWLASGLTQKKYCNKENIKITTFTWWRSKGLKDKVQTKPISFMPAIITEVEHKQPQAQDSIEVMLPNQIKLILPSGLSINILTELIKALRGLS